MLFLGRIFTKPPTALMLAVVLLMPTPYFNFTVGNRICVKKIFECSG